MSSPTLSTPSTDATPVRSSMWSPSRVPTSGTAMCTNSSATRFLNSQGYFTTSVKAPVQPKPVRRYVRWPDQERSHVLLRVIRRAPDPPGNFGGHRFRSDGRRSVAGRLLGWRSVSEAQSQTGSLRLPSRPAKLHRRNSGAGWDRARVGSWTLYLHRRQQCQSSGSVHRYGDLDWQNANSRCLYGSRCAQDMLQFVPGRQST